MSNVEPISVEGYDLLLEEFKFLKDIEKPRVNSEKQVAAAQGDRSENAEYHAAKEKLRHIDRRLFYLNSMIEKSTIIDPSKSTHVSVQFGSSVYIEDLEDESEKRFTLCGVMEMEAENGLISIHAPLAKAMLGKSVGDEFVLNLPKGKREFKILKIEYIPIFELKKDIKSQEDFSIK